MKLFNGKVVLITGAASGIGRATAERFADMGATVVLSDINDRAGEELKTSMSENGATAEYVPADVSNLEDVKALVRFIEDRFGRLDFAFNNAGVEGELTPLHEGSIENWQRVISINLSGVFYCMHEEIPLMMQNGEGVIVNCASIDGLVGSASASAYCASKHGIVGLTRAAALDYAQDGIRVNAVCPGVIDTAMVRRVIASNPSIEPVLHDMEPVGRLGRPEEVAAAVTWLCLVDSAFVTGIALPVDGGLTAR